MVPYHTVVNFEMKIREYSYYFDNLINDNPSYYLSYGSGMVPYFCPKTGFPAKRLTGRYSDQTFYSGRASKGIMVSVKRTVLFSNSMIPNFLRLVKRLANVEFIFMSSFLATSFFWCAFPS